MTHYHATYIALFGEIPPNAVIRTDLQEWAFYEPNMRFCDFLQRYYRHTLADMYSMN